ncbi:hypothetical protein PF672P1_00073 [Parabacteroides phage PF672P1]|nr:hypothetical protein PF672P1_00073 [Parabacteroides phage PF672P1]
MRAFHYFNPSMFAQVGMLLPLGLTLNHIFLEAEEGDIVVTNEGYENEFVCSCALQAASPQAEAISQMLYGLPVSKIIEPMREKYGREFDTNQLVFVVIKKRDYALQNRTRLRKGRLLSSIRDAGEHSFSYG